MNRREAMIGGALALGGAMGMGLQPRAARPAWVATPLDALVPMALPGGWRAVPGVAEAVVPADETGNVARTYGAVLARVYRDGAGAQVLAMIAGAEGIRGDRQIHRPEGCYPAAGFTIVASHDQPVPLAPGRVVPGGFLTARAGDRVEQVLYWIRVGDRFPRQAFGQEAAVLRQVIRGISPDGVLVRLSLVGGDAGAACALLSRFAGALVAGCGPAGRGLLANM